MRQLRYFVRHVGPGVGLLIGVALLVGSAMVFSAKSAKAEGYNSGCGIGVFTGHAIANADFGAPIGISSTGVIPGIMVDCGARIGSGIYAGATVSYGYAFQDLKTVGLNTDLSIGGRAGIILGANTLLYGHVSWSRLDTDFGKMDGWKWGPGVGIVLPGSTWELTLQYEIGTYNLGDVGLTGVDLETRTVRGGLSYRFDAKVPAPLASLADSPAPAKCDPKMANCKR